MKREEIDGILAAMQEPTDVAVLQLIGKLAAVIADQERRLRALEPCPVEAPNPHEWEVAPGFRKRCKGCGLEVAQ